MFNTIDWHAPPNVKNPAPMIITFIKTVNENPILVNFRNLWGVLFSKSSQKSCAEKCTKRDVAHMETKTRIEGDSALFPMAPKDG